MGLWEWWGERGSGFGEGERIGSMEEWSGELEGL